MNNRLDNSPEANVTARTEPEAFRFSTKAGTLRGLSRAMDADIFCDQIIIARTTWDCADTQQALDAACSRFVGKTLAVRSSAALEDGWENSFAGVNLSLTHVAPTPDALGAAVQAVFGSYAETSHHDEVLIQPMVDDVVISGVVLTRDLDTGGPYYAINYDDFSGRTDTVTGGAKSKTVLVHRSRPDALRSPRFRRLVTHVIEIERVTSTAELDIEFCITADDRIYILQVRPLAARKMWTMISDQETDNMIGRVRSQVITLLGPDDLACGKKSVLSEMTDWNPAEMIGKTPRPLALSLYRYLITDEIWARARANMGYRFVDGPLLHSIEGRPYIDVRRSFNSFLPAGLDDTFAAALVEHQIAVLSEAPALHDKVEFEIAVTCNDMNFAAARDRLKAGGFADADINELEVRLSRLTQAAIDPAHDVVAQRLALTEHLVAHRHQGDLDFQTYLRNTLAACRTYGTLPFSELARHGFIAVSMLKAICARGIFSDDERDGFMRSINTVATEFVHDIHAVTTQQGSMSAFLQRYGHLRPGTYDIESWRYDEQPELYLGTSTPQSVTPETFELTTTMRGNIQVLIDEAGFHISPDQLFSYIRRSVQAREAAKFAFTHCISDSLKAIGHWAEGLGFSREEASFLTIEEIFAAPDRHAAGEQIAAAREMNALTMSVRLPEIIVDAADVDVVRLPIGQPTFITNKSTTSRTILLGSHEIVDIDNRIVLIESADPGFDWVFSHPIRGLITMYGGANSHMAIRCAEFGMPAAIGCGERLFQNLSKADVIELNCAARRVGTPR